MLSYGTDEVTDLTYYGTRKDLLKFNHKKGGVRYRYLFSLLVFQGTFCLRGSLNVAKFEAGRNIPPHSPEDIG
jgi:hypothetical protein